MKKDIGSAGIETHRLRIPDERAAVLKMAVLLSTTPDTTAKKPVWVHIVRGKYSP